MKSTENVLEVGGSEGSLLSSANLIRGKLSFTGVVPSPPRKECKMVLLMRGKVGGRAATVPRSGG